MRILFLSTWFPSPPDNGSKIRVYHLLRALAIDHDVSLVAFSFGTARPELESQLLMMCRSVDTINVDPFERNRENILRRFMSSKPVVSKPIPAMEQLVKQILASDDFDIVISSGEIMASYALQAEKVITKVLEEHNSFSRLMYDRFCRSESSILKSRTWASFQKTKRYERKLFPQFDLITMVSEQDKEFCERHVNSTRVKIEIVPNGVDCQLNRPGLATPIPGRLVYSGALTYSANYDAMDYFLKEIYPLIRRKMPIVSLVITGSIDGVAIEQLALDESVRLTGYVDDIRLEIASAMALVAPLRVGGGSRLKILEAMALGTSIIATAKGVEGLAVSDENDLLIADDPAVFAEQTVRLLEHEDLRIKLTQRARETVQMHYDWQQIRPKFCRYARSYFCFCSIIFLV